MLVMSIAFFVIYAKTISRVGFEYQNTILVPSQENGCTVYSGTIRGKQACFMVSEDKTVVYQYGDKTFGPYSVTSDDVEGLTNGYAKDPAEPFASTILELVNGPELTHKGTWFIWFLVVFACVLNALSMMFEDELFYWELKFKIRNADRAEPSDWESVGRYIGSAVLTMMAFVLFMQGLQICL